MNTQTLSKNALSFFRVKRDKDKMVYYIDHKRPDWISEMIMDAKDESIPDDFVIKIIFFILDELSKGKNAEDISIECDIYINEKIDWLFGKNERIFMCDEILKASHVKSLEDVLNLAQIKEIDEIKENLISFLNNKLEEANSGD